MEKGKITPKNLYNDDEDLLEHNWDIITAAIYNLLKYKNIENNAGFSDDELRGYAGDIFKDYRESHEIYDFEYDRLDKLQKHIEKHIYDIPWCEDALNNMKKIFK